MVGLEINTSKPVETAILASPSSSYRSIAAASWPTRRCAMRGPYRGDPRTACACWRGNAKLVLPVGGNGGEACGRSRIALAEIGCPRFDVSVRCQADRRIRAIQQQILHPNREITMLGSRVGGESHCWHYLLHNNRPEAIRALLMFKGNHRSLFDSVSFEDLIFQLTVSSASLTVSLTTFKACSGCRATVTAPNSGGSHAQFLLVDFPLTTS